MAKMLIIGKGIIFVRKDKNPGIDVHILTI